MADGVRIRVRLKRVNLDRAQLNGPDSPVYTATERAAQAAVELARAEAPKRSGRLADSIEYRIYQTPRGPIADIGPGRGTSGVGTPPQEYARYVIEGTDSPIYPEVSPVLVIRDGGPKYHLKVSGQAANPFLQRALKRVRREDWGP